ncbi:MAG: hypothetical protein IT422_13890 [Pirellulaceae bacterium]|nr:hypothetical protein [Pirellulaceae bacterium]
MAINRIQKRLEKLEQTTAGADMSVEAERLLVSLLGRFDALWWPFRTHKDSYRAEVRRLQREYLAGQGGLKARSQGANNWKADHFTRNELIASGAVSPHMSGGQVTEMRLTPQGIADARAMVGDRLHTLDNQTTYILWLLLCRFEGCEHSGLWMIENNLLGEDVCAGDNSSKWDHATEYVLPLLSCGAVESCSDAWHRVYYRAVPGFELPTEPSSTATERPWADAAYVIAFQRERAALERSECLDGGIVIPMRCT